MKIKTSLFFLGVTFFNSITFSANYKLQRQLETQRKDEYIKKQIDEFEKQLNFDIKDEKSKIELEKNSITYKFNQIKILGSYKYRDEFQEIIAVYKNKDLTLEEVDELSEIFTSFFKNKGDIVTSVNLIEGNIHDGFLTFEVIEGKLNHIIYKSDSENYLDNLKIKMAFPLKMEDVINIHKIDQGLDNLNVGQYGYLIKIIPLNDEYYDILVEEVYSGRSIIIGADNSSYKDLGRYRTNVFLQEANLIGINDFWYFNYIERITPKRENDRESLFNLGLDIPLKDWKFGYSIEYGENQNKLETSLNKYKMDNSIMKQEFKAQKLLSRSSKSKRTFVSSIRIREYENKINDLKLEVNSKVYTDINIGIEQLNFIGGGVLFTSLEYERGVPWFGADRNKSPRRSGDFNLEYNKFEASLNWQKDFRLKNKMFLYNLNAGGFYSADRLLSINQFSMGDQYTVRGFKETAAYANKAIYLNNTLTLWNTGKIKPFVGVDIGVSKDKDLSEIDRMAGVAVGLRLDGTNFMGSMTYAIPLEIPKGLPKENNPIYLNLYYRF